MENDLVSESIHNWIDLIFGYKSFGKEAAEAVNLFYHLTYEEYVSQLEEMDEPTRIATESQIFHFGQTPLQIFKKQHPKRTN